MVLVPRAARTIVLLLWIVAHCMRADERTDCLLGEPARAPTPDGQHEGVLSLRPASRIPLDTR